MAYFVAASRDFIPLLFLQDLAFFIIVLAATVLRSAKAVLYNLAEACMVDAVKETMFR